jgi:predicted dehydrogenase
MTLRIGVLGAGSHSRGNHLPALRDFAQAHPGQIELAALCDLRGAHAAEMARQFGFQRTHTDLEAMLAAERLDGCIAITPVEQTARLAGKIIQAGVPLLMEKPPGATLAEGREVAAMVERTGAAVMVSMNRRFDPALCAGLDWLGDRPVRYLRATQARHNRREGSFLTETAIHVVDTTRFIGGDVGWHDANVWKVEGVRWAQIWIEFEGGATGLVEIMPTAGWVGERYELFGPDFHLAVRVGGMDTGEALAWEGGKLVLEARPATGKPDYYANGTSGETEAFLNALLEGRPFDPTPSQILGSVVLCDAIDKTVSSAG